MSTNGIHKGTSNGPFTSKRPLERTATVPLPHKGLEPLHRSTQSFRTIAEPPTSRGAAYLRNSVPKLNGDEKRDFSKAEQFRIKRRCNSIKAPSESENRTLEVRIITL